jgi:hypothetical protein
MPDWSKVLMTSSVHKKNENPNYGELININFLISNIGIVFKEISDDEISQAVTNKNFMETKYIYEQTIGCYRGDKDFDIKRIATIVNQIQQNTYDYTFKLHIYDDGEDAPNYVPKYDTDCLYHYHIRAFYYCKKDIRMTICRSP